MFPSGVPGTPVPGAVTLGGGVPRTPSLLHVCPSSCLLYHVNLQTNSPVSNSADGEASVWRGKKFAEGHILLIVLLGLDSKVSDSWFNALSAIAGGYAN